MSEIVFTRKVGDSAVARPQSAGATASATATIASLPASLSNASVGTLLKALVAAQTLRGLTTLETDKGTLMLQTNVPLKVGSELVLQVQSVGAQTRIAILSVDGHPMAEDKVAQVVTAKGTPRPGASAPTTGVSSGGASPEKAVPHSTVVSSLVTPRPGQRVMPPAVKGPLVTTSRNDSIAVHKGPVTPGLILPARVLAAGALTVATKAPSQSSTPTSKAVTSGEILTIRVLGFGAAGTAAPAADIPSCRHRHPTRRHRRSGLHPKRRLCTGRADAPRRPVHHTCGRRRTSRARGSFPPAPSAAKCCSRSWMHTSRLPHSRMHRRQTFTANFCVLAPTGNRCARRQRFSQLRTPCRHRIPTVSCRGPARRSHPPSCPSSPPSNREI